MENYMDKFRTPEEYIRAEVVANRGTQCVVFKKDLVAQLEPLTDADLDSLSKVQLFDLLVEKIGNEAYARFPVGVSSYNFQLKFDIDHTAVKRLAKAGVIHATAKQRFRKYGKYQYADLYSPYEYFHLAKEDVHAWLTANPARKRKTENNSDE